ADPLPGANASACGGARSGALGGSAGPAPWQGVRRCPAVLVGAADRAVLQPRQASNRRQPPAGPSCQGRECHAPSTPVPGAVSAALSHGLPGGAAACGQGGPQGGGGGRSLGGAGIRIGLQPPNKRLHLTPGSGVRWLGT